MNDIELFEQARRRVQKKLGNKNIRNKDVIIDQEKEIEYYRKKIQRMMENNPLNKVKQFDNYFEITIKDEEYAIGYNITSDENMMNAYLTKLVNEPNTYRIIKDNCFAIVNITRENNRRIFPYDSITW